jgi:predicted DNA-binding transcriptional regulator YafY
VVKRRRRERGRQLDRVLRLIRKFTYAREGATLAELKEEFGVSRRTVYRDLGMLARAGFHFEGGSGDDGRKRWRFPAGQRKTLEMTFTDAELMSLYFCMNLLSPLRGTPLREGLESALAKIESGFGPKDRARYGDLIFTHLARLGPHKDYSRHAETLSGISRACLDRQKVDVTYRSTADPVAKSYRFHPYCLAWSAGDLYTIGYSELRKEIRTLRIDRIARLSMSAEPFERPRDFDPEEYLLRGFGMYTEGESEAVRIEFSGPAARTIREKEWHPTQRLEERPGGRVVLKMNVQGLSEVARWVLYHAPDARVLEPPALRKLVADFAARAGRAHS